jgi:hypothetical protein
VVATGVLTGRSVSSVSVAADHACAVADGKAFCWGLNDAGQLGDGSTSASKVPVAVATDAGILAGRAVTAVAAGGEGPGAYTCAVATGTDRIGRAYCWGNNASGQLGNNTTTPSLKPAAVYNAGVLTGLDVRSISAGNQHACVTAGPPASDAKAYCWGSGANGRLGNGGTANKTVPVAPTVAAGSVTSISAGGSSSCAVVSSAAFCWGANGTDGALGNNSTADQPTPAVVTGLSSTTGFPALIQVTVTDGKNSSATDVKMELR